MTFTVYGNLDKFYLLGEKTDAKYAWILSINPGSIPIAKIVHGYYVRRSNNQSIFLELADCLWGNRDATLMDFKSGYKVATVTSKD